MTVLPVLMPFPVACLAGIGVLAAALLLELRKLPGERRRGLKTAGIVLAVLACLLFIGEAVLGALGFTWRQNIAWILSLAVWFAGWAAGILAARYASVLSLQTGKWKALSGVCWFCLALSMTVGTVWGGFWLVDKPAEEVGEVDGVRMLQTSWFDGQYHILPYNGPLIRKTEPLESKDYPYIRQLYGAEDALQLDLSQGEIIYSNNTHDNFLGDGETWVVVMFQDNALEEQMSQNWVPLPLSEQALKLVGKTDGNGWEIPKEGDGRWILIEDKPDGANPSGPSYDFTMAVWDRTNHQLVYWKLNT